mgnify:CR=1 FL=1
MSDGASAERGGMRKLYATALELGPLLLFFVANGKWGIFVGTGVFIVATAPTSITIPAKCTTSTTGNSHEL